MYEWLSRISVWLSSPFYSVADSNYALIAALFLGILGSVAPCQLTANAAAITYFGNRQTQLKISVMELMVYLLGKATVYCSLGFMFWLFGQQLTTSFIPVFAIARKFEGPLLIIIGFVLFGWLRFRGIGSRLSQKGIEFSKRIGGKPGAFLMGAAFSLGFCPTMFTLFFGSLMPLAVKTPEGFMLPLLFSIGTALPILLISSLSAGLGIDRFLLKRTKFWGKTLQIVSGAIFILIGIMDTITYWTL